MSTPKGISLFERYLTVWVMLCIVARIVLGKLASGVTLTLDSMAIYVNGAPVISIPITGFLLGVGKLPVPWQALMLSIGI